MFILNIIFTLFEKQWICSQPRGARETAVTMEGFLCESAGAKLRASRAWHGDWPKLSSDQIIGSFPFDAFSWDYFQRLFTFSLGLHFYQPWVPHCCRQKPSCCKKRRYQSRAEQSMTGLNSHFLWIRSLIHFQSPIAVTSRRQSLCFYKKLASTCYLVYLSGWNTVAWT